jgi:hypothetical protein
LELELSEPGSPVAQLLSSDTPEVVSVAKEIQSRGKGWVVTQTPEKNLIVLTALANLPKAQSIR